ncbi:NHL repeat-containing protein [Mucilaginibacter myungsuensis]|uniref:NHL repeat-containing protein n=1 Tax=Mucilaginibacter myungsuensis TaxID=649104 RepID=A0A929L4W9_9SPHI|nr:NHL repeat-containing protein [Mucilaginibacter myungsuensis]MBE9663286.1 hypothetical protein [Mucilaginibacter myungsuensis]MDN3600021.1 NHL repeat-containing protein [Mucilaginibacter myungsuensis]
MRSLLQDSRFFLILLASATFLLSGCTKSSPGTQLPLTATLYISPVVTGLTQNSVQTTGYVVNFVTGSISAYGVCYSTSNQTPTIADTRTIQTRANVLHFYDVLTGLQPNTTYYARNYATTETGTYYSDVMQFKTSTSTYSAVGDVTTYAGTGTAGSADGTLTTATFSAPQGMVADAQGNLYVSDSFNNQIRKISTGGQVTIFAGSTAPGYTEGTGTAARFYSPQNLAIDATGNIYVSDVGNNVIRKITPAGVVSTFAGNGKPGFADGSGSTVRFYNPAGMAFDGSGNMFVADRSNNRIRKITPTGVVSTYAGQASGGFNDGEALACRFNNPTAVAIDAQNNVYVADKTNNALRYITAAGVVYTVAGNPGNRTELLSLPVGLAFDKTGNLFISDESGRIFEMVAAKKAIYSIAGELNKTGFVNDRGTAASFAAPTGITTDAAGNVYVADQNNNVIRKVVVSITQ